MKDADNSHKSKLRTCPSAKYQPAPNTGYAWAYAFNDLLGTLRASAVPRLAETILVGDTSQIRSWGGASSATYWCHWTPEVWENLNGSLFDDNHNNPNAALKHVINNRNIDIDPIDAGTDATNGTGMVRYRHGSAKIGWADGHVSSLKKGQVFLRHFRFKTQER